ncbi:hypothetical protein [Deinococcus roseus]|uniref:Uncharacterized protein n=1 Tax=Deinococcus roseus TaxID=392414 RepID=A0ABQ2D474_9DEIO|nr:hypothetical protein [Deinococcus roseus]GGJ44800.1 hypothetical protein GCM10008938_33770 [Deinococcus roseus]
MEHPNLRTLHFDDVPRSLAREIVSFSDLTWFFGPRGEGFFGQDLGEVAVRKLGMTLPNLRTATQDRLETAILDRASELRSHLLLVIQIHPSPVEGYVCLIPHTRLHQVEEVLSRVADRRR